jgi:hypothetical protein
MVAANNYQVGGAHYKTSYEHWDWALDIGLGYLDGVATKYMARAGKKAGVDILQDLEKSRHYTVKMIEEAPRLLLRLGRPPRRWIVQRTDKFLRANDINDEAATVVRGLAAWDTPDDLRTVIRLIEKLESQIKVQRLAADDPITTAKPVPLEDSNKHANRFVGGSGDYGDPGAD